MRIPTRLKKRPQWRGLPIPYIAYIDNEGKPDFRVTDEEKRISVMRYQLCQLCGEPLGRFMFFVGGTEAAKANQYFEPAAHLDCLLYAMQVCPFIVGRIEHVPVDKVAAAHPELTVKTDQTFTTTRNQYWVIVKANGYRFGKTPDNTILNIPSRIAATPPIEPDKMDAEQWGCVMDALMKL